MQASFKHANISSTFAGIGYVALDVNGLIMAAETLFGLDLKQLPTQTVCGYFRYILDNLRASGLQEIVCYYGYQDDPWKDYLMSVLKGDGFILYSELPTTVLEDRIALFLTSSRHLELLNFCSRAGLYAGILESLEFVCPQAYAMVASPAEHIEKSPVYNGPCNSSCAIAIWDCVDNNTSIGDCVDNNTQRAVDNNTQRAVDNNTQCAVDNNTSISNSVIINYVNAVEKLLGEKGFTVETMTAAVESTDHEYVYAKSGDAISRPAAECLLGYSLACGGFLFDGRVYFGLRSIAPPGEPVDRSVFMHTFPGKWSGQDLALIMPPIPDRPNQRHIANIRRSALSMHERIFRFFTVVESSEETAPRKLSAKMKKIVEQNTARIQAEKEKAANAWLRGFYESYTKFNSLASKRAYIESIRVDDPYVAMRLSLLKMELYMDLWRLEQRSPPVDERVLVPLYLECLSFIEQRIAPPATAGPDEIEFVFTKLVEAGFEATARELIEKYSLPEMNLPFETNATSAPNDTDLYFQLKYAGDHLKRTLGTRKDARVQFDPDKWQVELLDAVDARQSAVVAAPTSSGKTFICFYAIESVLRASDTDVAVFCLPTKALANQVSADIYARFNQKNCRMSLQGSLMADRCSEPFNCQVLITIPSMLESYLTSPHAKNLKYIIIDEVHKINDESIGLSIERIVHLAQCPLLLLSATIGNLSGFYRWFSEIEKSKGRESVLVTHTERFCELKPFLYHSTSGSEKGRLMPLNCMFAYSFSHLRDFGFGDDISFLPEELLNLYYYIYVVLGDNQKRLIKRLAPKRFFKSNIICKADTREYQRHLLTTFQEWVQQGILDEEQVKRVYSLLVGDTIDAFPLDSSEQYLADQIFDLLETLKEEDKLPVIVFNTDRELVTRLARAVHGELEARDMRKKKDKMAEKMKKENKRARDSEKTKDSWIEESIMSELSIEPDTRDMRFTYLSQATRLSDAEAREEMSDLRATPRFATEMVYRGIGIHHAGMDRRYRSAVEILFRKKHVRVIFATETLALGINMPCRTVVFAGDSLALDPMNYKQMAGRAGRRGYDTLGNIVFLGIPRARVQNLMVSMLPHIQGAYALSNTSLISFGIEESIVKHPLLGEAVTGIYTTNSLFIDSQVGKSKNLSIDSQVGKSKNLSIDSQVGKSKNLSIDSQVGKFKNLSIDPIAKNLSTDPIAKNLSTDPIAKNLSTDSRVSPYCFTAHVTEENRRKLVAYQKQAYPFIHTDSPLWDLFISNRCEDPAIFVFGLLFSADVLPWDQEGLISVIAHLFEVRPCSAPTVLGPLPTECEEVISQLNAIYFSDLKQFYSPELRTLSTLAGKPLHFIKSFIYTLDCPKNSYIVDFFHHGSSNRIAVRNGIPGGSLWQSLYNVDYLLCSFIKMIEGNFPEMEKKLNKLKGVYEVLHKKFRDIFA